MHVRRLRRGFCRRCDASCDARRRRQPFTFLYMIRHNALKRLVSPSAPSRRPPSSKAADADGEGAWSELPLGYDGRAADAEARVLSRRRRLVGCCRPRTRASGTFPRSARRSTPTLGRVIGCGTPVVATVLRLAPVCANICAARRPRAVLRGVSKASRQSSRRHLLVVRTGSSCRGSRRRCDGGEGAIVRDGGPRRGAALAISSTTVFLINRCCCDGAGPATCCAAASADHAAS